MVSAVQVCRAGDLICTQHPVQDRACCHCCSIGRISVQQPLVLATNKQFPFLGKQREMDMLFGPSVLFLDVQCRRPNNSGLASESTRDDDRDFLLKDAWRIRAETRRLVIVSFSRSLTTPTCTTTIQTSANSRKLPARRNSFRFAYFANNKHTEGRSSVNRSFFRFFFCWI